MITIDKYLEDERTGEEFCVEFTADITNDGIGAYEYWGQRCFDKGQACIDDISFKADGLDEYQAEQARALIDSDELEADFFAELENRSE